MRTKRRFSQRVASYGASAAVLALLMTPAAPARASSTCYKLPFPNPNLNDGWGSLCCGRKTPHRGVDFPQPQGTSIPAVADGVVRVKTWSDCLGYVVVLEHPDGMFSGYSHMVNASSLKKGDSVKKGGTVGKVGTTGSCSTGPHLHLTLSPNVDGWGYGTTVDPYKYIQAHKTCNKPPKGALEAADCESIVGWAQDPSEPKASIKVRFSYDGTLDDPDSIRKTRTADVRREDLCEPLGSCKHGFAEATPLSFFDGDDHTVRVYGLDTEGGDKTKLDGSPMTFACDAPAADGVLRPVSDATFAAWGFTTFQDTIPGEPEAYAALEIAEALPEAPWVLRADDDSEERWLLDGADAGVRRQIPDAAIAAAWRLDLDVALVLPRATIEALREGPPLRPRPQLVELPAPGRFVLDDALPQPPLPPDDGDSDSDSDSDSDASGDSSGDSSSGGATTDADATGSGDADTGGDGLPPGYGGEVEEGGCGCSSRGDRRGPWGLALTLGLLFVVRRRR